MLSSRVSFSGMLPNKAEEHVNPKQLLRYTAEYSGTSRHIATFVQKTGALAEVSEEAPQRSLHLKRRGCRQCRINPTLPPKKILTGSP